MDQTLKYNFSRMIEKYKSKYEMDVETICQIKINFNYYMSKESYQEIFTDMGYFVLILTVMLRDDLRDKYKLFSYYDNILLGSTTKLNINDDIVYIEYRGFRIDNLGENIYSLKEYDEKLSKIFKTENLTVLPRIGQLLETSKYIDKFKIKGKTIYMLKKNIFKKKYTYGYYSIPWKLN